MITQQRPASIEEGPERQRDAIAALDALLRLRPDDVWTVRWHLWLERGGPQRVMPLVEKLVSLRPNSLEVLTQASYRSASVGELEAARSYLARARPLLDLSARGHAGNLPSTNARILMFEDAWSRDDIDQAVALAAALETVSRRSSPEDASLQAEGVARVFLTLGQLDRAERTVSDILRKDPVQEMILGSVALSRRDPQWTRDYLDRFGIDGTFTSAASFLPGFVIAGRLDDARAAVEQMRRTPGVPADFADTVEAQLALAEGRPLRAIALLEPVIARQPGPDIVRSNALADAWVAAGDEQQAIRVLERVAFVPRRMRRPGIMQAHHWLEQQDRLSSLYREVGRTAEAVPIGQRLRVLLKFADEDHPIKRRLAGVSGSQ